MGLRIIFNIKISLENQIMGGIKMGSVKILSGEGKGFTVEKTAVAHINPRNCVNCGTCRELCPMEAISESQRVICRICPECTEQDAMTFDEMYEFTTKAACTMGCPLGISPQGYINLTRSGKLEEAYKLVWDKNPLPSVCARICHHPCEQVCKRGVLVDEPIAIRSIKRYLGEKTTFRAEKYPRLYEERIAVIGAGPAGLTAGHYLSRAGYEVTVFESATEAGGMLKRGIPEFRLDRSVVDEEVTNLENAGLAIRLNERINKHSLEKIQKEYDAVIVAAGAPNSKELKIEGWRLSGVMTAMDFMEQVNHRQEIRRHPGQIFNLGGEVVVIGGGSVAIDTARAALRMGATKVTAVCLECDEEIPCHPWELKEAEDEGITLIQSHSPTRFVGTYPKLEGVEVCKVTSFSKDGKGKISCELDENDTMTIKADWAIVAIGQAPDTMWSSLKGDRVYFAGDISKSACSVIDAMASGRKVALNVDTDLRGRTLKDPMDTHELHSAPLSEKIYPYNRRKSIRPEIPMLAAESRIHSFDEVEGGFDDEAAQMEVLRCLRCGYQVVDEERCIGCGICQRECPEGDVITMEPVAKGGEK